MIECRLTALRRLLMCVMQVLNLRRALRERMTPLQLVQMPWSVILSQPTHIGRVKRYKQLLRNRLPFFKNC